jgi:hypothetical protein
VGRAAAGVGWRRIDDDTGLFAALEVFDVGTSGFTGVHDR